MRGPARPLRVVSLYRRVLTFELVGDGRRRRSRGRAPFGDVDNHRAGLDLQPGC
jgi:hypothetical protein